MASRFISWAMKSSLRPMLPPSRMVFLVVSMWLFRRTSSSSTQTLSAKIVTSITRRFSSTWASPRSSFTFASRFCRYSAMICGALASMKATCSSMPSSFPIRSFCRFSPSLIRARVNASAAPLSAFSSVFQMPSSSIFPSSMEKTSGKRASEETVMSSFRENSSAICLKYLRYSAAVSRLYLTVPPLSVKSS